MSIFENILIIGVYLAFPIACYLIYIAYATNMDFKIKNLFLEFSLLTSLFLMIKFVPTKSLYCLLFYNIPLLLAFIKKKNKTAIMISVIIVLCYYYYGSLPLSLLCIEYIIYYILYLKIENKETLINVFVALKSFLISFLVFYNVNPHGSFINNISCISFSIITFIIFTYLSLFLFRKGEEIANLSNAISENKREKRLYESLSKLTHELKNPITVCKGYIEIINKNGMSSAESYIPIISEEIDRALLVINDFSTLGKATTINKEEVDLKIFTEEIIDVVRPLLNKYNAKISLTSKDEIYVSLDYNRMKQVLVNVLKNAIEARKEEEPLEIKVELKEYSNCCKIIVKDNGIGMSKETLAKIYDMFYTTKSIGSGLGVVLSKEIVELHKGTMKYDSKLGEGTKVTITLPIK